MKRDWYVYILECADGSYYTGMTKDPELRLEEHNAGLDPSAYTFSRRPVRVIWTQAFPARQDALAREHQVKGWSRLKKAALIQDAWDRVHAIVQDERRRRDPARRHKE